MTRTIMKGIALVVMVAAVSGVCVGPCVPVWVEVIVVDVAPPGGPIAEDSVTISVNATEEKTVAVCHDLMIWLDRWNEQAGYWQFEAHPSSWAFGEPTPTGECSSIRDVDVTFEDVSLAPGQNRFQIVILIDGCDGYEDEWIYHEVTYTR